MQVHGAAVGDGQQPAAQVTRRGEAGICGVGLGPGLLRNVVTVDRSGQRTGEAGDVAPVRIHEPLERGQVHTG